MALTLISTLLFPPAKESHFAFVVLLFNWPFAPFLPALLSAAALFSRTAEKNFLWLLRLLWSLMLLTPSLFGFAALVWRHDAESLRIFSIAMFPGLLFGGAWVHLAKTPTHRQWLARWAYLWGPAVALTLLVALTVVSRHGVSVEHASGYPFWGSLLFAFGAAACWLSRGIKARHWFVDELRGPRRALAAAISVFLLSLLWAHTPRWLVRQPQTARLSASPAEVDATTDAPVVTGSPAPAAVPRRFDQGLVEARRCSSDAQCQVVIVDDCRQGECSPPCGVHRGRVLCVHAQHVAKIRKLAYEEALWRCRGVTCAECVGGMPAVSANDFGARCRSGKCTAVGNKGTRTVVPIGG